MKFDLFLVAYSFLPPPPPPPSHKHSRQAVVDRTVSSSWHWVSAGRGGWLSSFSAQRQEIKYYESVFISQGIPPTHTQTGRFVPFYHPCCRCLECEETGVFGMLCPHKQSESCFSWQGEVVFLKHLHPCNGCCEVSNFAQANKRNRKKGRTRKDGVN